MSRKIQMADIKYEIKEAIGVLSENQSMISENGLQNIKRWEKE